MDEALFTEHLDWAVEIAASVKRKLPPSFDIEDLQQTARIEHWKRCESYDPKSGVPYRAYAYVWIRGAVLMSCRRRNYTDNTHQELDGVHIDKRPLQDEAMLAREERRNVSGPRERRKLAKATELIGKLSPADAYLVKRVYLEGQDPVMLAKLWGGNPKVMGRRLSKAVAKLKRARIG